MKNIAILILIISCCIYIIINKRNQKNDSNLLKRFRQTSKRPERVSERFQENYSNSLILNPENNIQIGKWDKENTLREKADIHRARLIKYGRSKINGEMLFMESEGKVYKLNKEGEKKYI